MSASCPLCRQRKSRRECPALRQTICPVCCGTKRLREIACPEDCVYLASARVHPAAVVRRQQEQDVAELLPSIRNLTERQYHLFLLFQTAIARHQPDGFARLVDADVAEAAGSLAATLETSAKGVLYDHAAQSLPAQRLAGDLKQALAQVRERGLKVQDGEAAATLRAIEQGARDAQGRNRGDAAYLELMGRLLQVTRGQPARHEAESTAAGTIILP